MPRKKVVPKYSHHKASGQAKVRIDGTDHYLGSYGSDQSKRRYAELIAEWNASLDSPPDSLSVGHLSLMYLEWARNHYRKGGEETSEIAIIRQALKRLNRQAAKLRATDISPRLIKQIRETMIDEDLARTTINKLVSRIRAMVKWAVGEEILAPTVLVALQAVPDLKRGRCEARETEKVKPVPQAHIQAISDDVSPAVWAMVSLQLVTGMRPGEVRIMRACDIDMSGDVWLYVPSTYKTEHHERERIVAIGPKGQEIIREWLTTETHAYLFPSIAGKPYRRDSYRTAIVRACERAEVPSWSPNQLRHNFGTAARREAGLEASRVTLGHSNVRMSEVYAERDLQAACDIVSKIG